MANQWQIKRLAGALGAEVSGTDLTTTTNSDIQDIKALLTEHKVLFFPGQNISPEQHVAFGHNFGELENHPNLKNPFTDHPYIFELAATQRGIAVIANGTNLDDLGDHRPGLIAADNHKIRSPLVESGFHKADIRALAHELGLENANKPQAACLSSRFPYGTAINQELLAQVEAAEDVLAQLGFSQFRVRHHGEVARLEVLPKEFSLAAQHHQTLEQRIKALGYRFVTMDLGGFRSGSLNEGLRPEQIQVVNIFDGQEQ